MPFDRNFLIILLNGMSALFAFGIFQITALNFFAIMVENMILKSRYKYHRVLLRVIIANIVSVFAGLVVLYWIPEVMGANIQHSEGVEGSYNLFGLFMGIIGMFIANVLVEWPVYLINANFKEAFIILWQVFFANLISNIPVFLLYSTQFF